MLLRIFYYVFILLCLYCVSCSGVKIATLSANQSADTTCAPAENGPCRYTIVTIDSLFPDYMRNVNILSVRIPTTHARPPFPVILIEPGYFSVTTNIEDIQNRYATHGFLVIGVTNTSQFRPFPKTMEPFRLALQQALRFTIESNLDSTSPLFKKVDTSAIGISGHSMGGGGTLLACNDISYPYHRYIKTAVAMNPFGKCRSPDITMPILFISSEIDSVALHFFQSVSSCPADIFYSFQSVPETTTKLFTTFKGMDHNALVDRNILLRTSGNAALFLPTMVSWFKVYLVGDSSYKQYLDTTGTGFSTLKSRFISRGDVPAYLYIQTDSLINSIVKQDQ